MVTSQWNASITFWPRYRLTVVRFIRQLMNAWSTFRQNLKTFEPPCGEASEESKLAERYKTNHRNEYSARAHGQEVRTAAMCDPPRPKGIECHPLAPGVIFPMSTDWPLT